jgi:hypothetical protein
MEPNKKMIEIKVEDKSGRGDLVIEKTAEGKFQVWLQLEDIGGCLWELSGLHENLCTAVSEVAEILKINAENEFYNDQ